MFSTDMEEPSRGTPQGYLLEKLRPHLVLQEHLCAALQTNMGNSGVTSRVPFALVLSKMPSSSVFT